MGKVEAEVHIMKKNIPTLADAMIAMALDKRMNDLDADRTTYRHYLLSVAHARKFVFDDAMSGFISDIERGLCSRGGIRKRFYAIESARMMSRLPHEQTFIEFNYHAYIAYIKSLGIRLVHPAGTPGGFDREATPPKIGWLMRQHSKFENVFMATEVHSSRIAPNMALIHPVSIVWTVDNSPLPVQTVPLYSDEEDQTLLVMLQGYKTDQAGWALTFNESLSTKMADTMGAWERKPAMTARAIWGVLSTINDLPVQIEHIEPSRGYISRGSYKKFLKHSIVHLTVPETRWRKLVTKVAALVRRRAHQVRGHLREDWRHPLSALCKHVYNEELHCINCGGRQFWVHEHQRGDASLGFVIHDYEVGHRPTP